MSPSARVVGVIRRPRHTLQEVVSEPRWAGLLLTLTLVTAAAGAAVSSTEVGQLALVDQWERTSLALGQGVDDARYAEMQTWSHQGAAISAATAVIAGPGLAVAVALCGFLWLRWRSVRVSFTQVMAVAVHAGVILAIGRLLAAPLVYARETTASATTVGAWFSTLDEGSPIARFLGAIDLFSVWWVVVLGIGLAVLSGRPARTCAAWLLSIYLAVAVGAAAVMALAA